MQQNVITVSARTYKRLVVYYKKLIELKEEGLTHVSSVQLAKHCEQNASVVKKDLSVILSEEGKPKIGYEIDKIIEDIERSLDYTTDKKAIIVGVGNLGKALLNYRGFEEYGLQIVAGLDSDENTVKVGKIAGKPIYHIDEMKRVISKTKVKMAILTTPGEVAQEVVTKLIECNVLAIWNFTNAHVIAPKGIAIRQENMAASLAILSNQLKQLLKEQEENE